MYYSIESNTKSSINIEVANDKGILEKEFEKCHCLI
jgi:hypothetical protein